LTTPRRSPIRVLIAKPGLDGHDVGAKVVSRALMHAGMEVIYTGLRRSHDDIAQAALEEDVDVLGVSLLSGAHVPLCEKLAAALRARDLTDIVWIVGGNIPRRDHEALTALGVHAIFPTGTPFETIVDFIEGRVTR
jgi:methylmalonyl-CoA mutase C-terminal domain/subunit